MKYEDQTNCSRRCSAVAAPSPHAKIPAHYKWSLRLHFNAFCLSCEHIPQCLANQKMFQFDSSVNHFRQSSFAFLQGNYSPYSKWIHVFDIESRTTSNGISSARLWLAFHFCHLKESGENCNKRFTKRATRQNNASVKWYQNVSNVGPWLRHRTLASDSPLRGGREDLQLTLKVSYYYWREIV